MKPLLFSTALLMSSTVWAGPSHDHPAPVMPKEFDVLKKLVGTWEGENEMNGQKQKVTVVYELTSGGSALVEKLMPGTPHEMITVFHREGNTLGMTHYCAIGNQPHMMLNKASGSSLTFEMKSAQGVASMNEPHMHALTVTLADNNTLKEEWVHFTDGKANSTTTFNLARK